ncbi:MAG: hypothetical protein CUN56_10710 [Phototrophicales bacterium]|nr:MAG: hypothetical protein CUN56_10710 [Phototrophicales bacterium]
MSVVMRSVAILGLLILVLFGVGCQSTQDPAQAVNALPVGDAERGSLLFQQSIGGAPTCASCHTLNDQRLTGPGLAGYGERAATTVSGQSAEVYTYQAIVRPAAHVVAGYSNIMYTEYSRKLNQQQIADLIAFLLEQ